MSITVTPIPTLIEFATPSITIGATAAAGDALTAIRSNSTIAGVALVASTVDNSIARFSGTAGQLQGYTSNSPTISDAGVISLTSGQLTFPATVNLSADANTLDDYEEGSWTPLLGDSDYSDKGQSYTSQVGHYVRVGKVVHIAGLLEVNSLGSLTTSSACVIMGLPFTSQNVTDADSGIAFGNSNSLSVGTAGYSVGGTVYKNTSRIAMGLWDSTTGMTNLLISEFSAGGKVTVGGSYFV